MTSFPRVHIFSLVFRHNEVSLEDVDVRSKGSGVFYMEI